jgi:hypothetical protein
VGSAFDIGLHDTLFSSRTNPDDWARIHAFRSSADFLAGVRRHEGVMAPFFAHNFLLNKVVLETWRFQMLVFTLYLHDSRDKDDPRSGLSLVNLQQICRQLDLASPGRVFAFLNLMKLGGYLVSHRSAHDSRIVHLVPTPMFLDIVEEWNDGIFASIDAAFPDGALLQHRARMPALGQAMRTHGAKALLAGWKPLDPFPEVSHFASADGGWLLMEHIVAASLHQSAGSPAPVRINLRDASSRFGGSRTNLRRLLDRGHELGLLALRPDATTPIIFTSRMICAFLTFIASYLSNFQQCAQSGLAELHP